MTYLPEELARDIEWLVRERAPGWEVETREERVPGGGSAATVELKHPLSEGAILSWIPERPLTLDVVERWLTESLRWEIEVISQAPPPVYPEAIRALRVYAEAYGWSVQELRGVAGMLRDCGGLSEEEEDWVCRFFGEGGPDAPGANPRSAL